MGRVRPMGYVEFNMFYLEFVRLSLGDNCHQATTKQPFHNFRVLIIATKYLLHSLYRRKRE